MHFIIVDLPTHTHHFSLRKKQLITRSTSTNGRLLTRIHNKWYDLSEFNHPGGPIALGLARGRDATALFESHHYFIPRKKLLQVLTRYEVSPKEAAVLNTLDNQDDDSPFDWTDIDNDGFASDLHQLVVDHFSEFAKHNETISISEASKATTKRWIVIWSFIGLFFASLPAFVQGKWVFLLVTPLLAWLAIVTFWHDAMHFALSTDWKVNAMLPYLLPLISSPSMWYVQHNIGHHVYTNIGHKDPDLAHAPQLMREHESIKWRTSHLNQARSANVLFVWSIAAGIGLNILNDVRATIKLSYNNVVPCERPSMLRLGAHIVGRILYIYCMHIWPFFHFPQWKAWIWAIVPNALFSVCFMVNSQISHLNCSCAHASDTNFYKHQAATSQNFGHDSTFCYYFSGGLNYQIEHHLFPNINHCHLPALSPGVKKICEKHGVPYNYVSGYREALNGHFEHTASLASNPMSD